MIYQAGISSSRSPARSPPSPANCPTAMPLTLVLDSAVGLTRVEAENAFSLSLIRHGRVTPDVMWELKAQTLKKSGLMTIHRAARLSPTWWSGSGKGVLPEIAGPQADELACSTSRRASARRQRYRQECLLQGSRQRGRSAHAHARHRRAHGLAGRDDRGANAPGPPDRGRDGSVHRPHRRDRERSVGRAGERPDRQRPSRPGCSARFSAT